MNAAQRIADVARRQLADVLELSGEVLYSAAATLVPGPVYLLGHNPGGDSANPALSTVGSSLAELPTKTINSYLDTLWSGRQVGQAPLQRRVIWLLRGLDVDPRSVAASNLIFARSRDAAGSRFDQFAGLCWPVHQEILRVVAPRLVISYGNSGQSPYQFLRRRVGVQGDVEETYPSGHGSWRCRSFVAVSGYRVVGLPHLSRYDISAHPDVLNWIKAKICQPSV